MIGRISLAVAIACALPAAAPAQVVPGRFQVSVDGAWQSYAESSALENAALAGLHAAFYLNRNIGIGGHIFGGRPWTKGEYFPYVRHSYLSSDETNDTTLLHQANMRVTHLQVGVDATFRYEIAGFAPYGFVSLGRYRFFLDPQQLNGLEDLAGTSFQVGGGVEWQVGEASGLRFGIVDNVLQDFDRDRFCVNCTGAMALLREDRFPNPNPLPPAKEATVHNFRITGSFSFVPGGQP